jgi:signal transduction histidine kinase/CheY-like chemotaxis protein/HAMP domain-containing protein
MSKISLNIGTQLEIGFAVILALSMILGVVSYVQTQRLQGQTETLFNHPFQVSKSISVIETEIQKMEVAAGELKEATDETIRLKAIQDMESAANTANKQFNIVIDRYLGPRDDVNNALMAFARWKANLYETSRTIQVNKSGKLTSDIRSEQILREELFPKLKRIDDFAFNKANGTFENSQRFGVELSRQLISLIIVILILSIIINYVLMKSIRKPLRILNDTTHRFRHGDMNARSTYHLTNEFGLLSESFNKLADRIQQDVELSEKKASLSVSMLSENDARTFFKVTLTALLKLTNSQIAALYLPSDDQKTLELHESIGLSGHFRRTFDLQEFEGEVGPAVSTRQVQKIKVLQEDEHFVFETVCGSIKPCEIITIPLFFENRIVATVHLASIYPYDTQSQKLIESSLDTLSTRFVGILASHKIKTFSEKLETQNRELETQKMELSKQSETLLNQNTELEIQKQELGEANKLKTIFLSNMSHELRTPLNSVIALSGVLNRRLADKIPDDEYSYLEVIERNGKHLLSLINDILDLSRIEAGREDLEIIPFDADRLIAEIVEMVEPQAKEKNIELHYSTDGNEIKLCSDQKKCRQMLLNIVGNAVKFTEKGRVEIGIRKEDSFMVFDISDTGIGISENQLNHIFDEFRQADNSTSRRFGGTGLGLSIARKYAELLGGYITVKSTPGEGSVFTLRIPIQYSESDAENIEIQRTKKDKTLKHQTETYQKTILLVDDSEPAIIQLSDVLQEGGYNTMIARNGMESIEKVTQTIPDAIILDLMMPGMDGFEVLKTLRENNLTANVPVLILTAKHITKEELHFLKRNNIHQLVQKGDIKRNDLLKAVEEMAFQDVPVTVASPSMDRQKPIILVVEDNPDNMITAKALLSDHYRVLEAVDGNEALLMTKLYVPNLILMDIELPGIDGIETFKIIRNDVRLQNIPIVALTASAMTTERETILAHGFDGYIAKPIEDNVFSETIKHILYG